jgi:hypothetical protein
MARQIADTPLAIEKSGFSAPAAPWRSSFIGMSLL